MAITIDYITYEINIEKDDTTLTGTNATTGREERELDMDDFWKALGDVQDNQTDVWAPTAYTNTSPQDLGTFTLGRSVLILEPYVVTFEDGSYSVNLVNGNTNIASRLTVNSVQVIPNNSGGLVVSDSSSGGDSVWTEDEKNEMLAYVKKASDNAEQANQKL